MKETIKKDLSVETLRGLAIILVVMGHVIGSKSDGGMKVADDSFLRHLYYTFQYLRMPLFTVISGWVYALRPVTMEYWKEFSLKKIRRLLLPLIFVGGVYYIVQNLVPGTNFSYPLKNIWHILILPYTLYWYLMALFICFLVISFIDSQKLIDTVFSWSILFGAAILLLIFRDTIIPKSFPDYFGFEGAIYLFPFFVLGIGIKRFASIFRSRIMLWIISPVLVIGMIIQQLAWYGLIHYHFSPDEGLGLVIGVTGVIMCLRIHVVVDWLVWMGKYAYTIYLFHSFGTSGGRILLNDMGIDQTTWVFLISLGAGLVFPILVELVLDRYSITRMLFLGRAWKNTEPPKKTVRLKQAK
jgi:glucans biosynthesis protein C